MVGGRILNSSAQELGACAQHSHTRTHERTHEREHSLTHEHSHICTRYSANSHTSTTTSINAHASANAHEKHTPSHSKKTPNLHKFQRVFAMQSHTSMVLRKLVFFLESYRNFAFPTRLCRMQ